MSSHQYTNLSLEKNGRTALLTLVNPPANTWTVAALRDLARLVQALNMDRSVSSLIVTGEGSKFFCAGADLNLFAAGDKKVAQEMAECFGHAFEALANFRGVSIAAINGYAMGGGLECALACDLRIVEEHAQLALPEAAVGLLPCAGGTQLLPWLVGEGWAKRMILCGERINAETAVSIGLAEELVSTGGAKSRAFALAEQVAKQSPTSIVACKKLIQGARANPLTCLLPLERTSFLELFDSPNQQEGVQAFLHKRAAQWSDQ